MQNQMKFYSNEVSLPSEDSHQFWWICVCVSPKKSDPSHQFVELPSAQLITRYDR